MGSLDGWHQFVERREPAMLDDILSEDCVFLSPVVHTPQRGRDITKAYLTAAMHVLNGGFHYIKQVVSPEHAVLEFVCDIDGITVNGVDILSFNAEGKICEFKVMIRPLKAVNAVHGKMREMLETMAR